MLIDRNGHIKLTDFGLSSMGLADSAVNSLDAPYSMIMKLGKNREECTH
jgi:serine/threonine protein kinase